jgi:hypothetical protein
MVELETTTAEVDGEVEDFLDMPGSDEVMSAGDVTLGPPPAWLRDQSFWPRAPAGAVRQNRSTTTGHESESLQPDVETASVKTPQPRSRTNPTKQKEQPSPSGIQYMPQAELDAEQAKLEALSQAAIAGDTAALDQLRAALDNCPHIWRRLADLQILIETRLVELIAGKDRLRLEGFRRRSSELRRELCEDNSAMFVKLAASRVVSCWLFCQFIELQAIIMIDPLQNYKQREYAERRFGIAMRAYATAKRLELQLTNQQRGQ